MLKSRIDKEFEQYYKQYIEYVKSYCRYRLYDYPDFVEDCVQDTFRVLYEKLSNDVEFEYVKAFLLKTASNFVNLKFREIDKSKNKTVSIDDVKSKLIIEDNFFNDVSEETIYKLKDEIISSLSFEEQELLSHTCKQDKDSYRTTKQLAKMYGCSETNIRQRIFVLRAKIKILINNKTKNL